MSDISRREPLLLNAYRQYLRDHDTVKFVTVVKSQYSPGTLERLARSGDVLLRSAAVFGLGFVGDFRVNHTVGRALIDEAPDVRRLARNASRFVWNRFGSPQQRERLAGVIGLSAAGDYQPALEQVCGLLDEAPCFAEAWYHRGAVYYQLRQFDRATTNCCQALELNPYQFVAATAMGDAYLQLEDPSSALEAFRRALRVNPDMDGVRERVSELSRQFDDE